MKEEVDQAAIRLLFLLDYAIFTGSSRLVCLCIVCLLGGLTSSFAPPPCRKHHLPSVRSAVVILLGFNMYFQCFCIFKLAVFFCQRRRPFNCTE